MSSLPPGYDNWRTRAPGDGPDDPIEEQTHDAQEELVTCIGCGCDDFEACETANGGACHWLRIDEDRCLGVCSECPDHVARFDSGDRSQWNEPEARGLLLPGDDEYNETLRDLRRH